MFSTYSSRVAELLQKIESGEIALPDLQRPFVWEDAKVRNLLDSMNKGFPVGYVMLWDFPDDYDAKPRSSAIAKSGTRSVRSLLIDGQQRLTALLSAMDGIVVKDKDYRDRRIRISFNPLAKADDGKQIGQFEVWTSATEKDPEWVSDITEVYKLAAENPTTGVFMFCQAYYSAVNASHEKKGLALLTTEEQAVVYNNINKLLGLRNYTQTNVIVPDAHGDWLNQRDDSYAKFMRVDGKKTKESSIFLNYSNGIKSGRDSWVYNSSRNRLCENIKTSINYFNACVDNLLSNKDYLPIKDDAKIKWNETQDTLFQKKEYAQKFDLTKIRLSVYRHFIPSFLYFDKFWNLRQYQMTKIFPESKSKNLVICSSGVGSKEYSCLMVDHIPCLDFLEKTQCFPRWLPGEQTKGAEDTLDFGEPSEMPSGFSQEALPHFQAAYPGKPITEDDLFYYIYGILHSEDYRMRYANNLMKELPRIPRVATYEQFMAFVEAGQELARLHVHFEDVAPYAGVKFEYTKVGQPSYRVTQMKWGKIKGKTGNAAKDKTTLIYNDWITVKNIPLEAQEYVVNKKSALDWVVERACVSIDKASGIVNDFNDYAAEMGSERYPLDLFLKIITVSLETMKIVKTLPKLEIHPLDK